MINLLYPNKIKKEKVSNTTYANRGMDLEYLINEANKYYLESDIAVIYKKPTPIQINKVNFESGKPIITKGKFNQKSTLDYVGLYKGMYLDFDAKVTKNKTSFPLSNIHEHQIKHIKNIIKHGGYAFLIIEINHEVYLFSGKLLIDFTEKDKRKSIPYEYINKYGIEIKYGYNPIIDYLKAFNELTNKEDA